MAPWPEYEEGRAFPQAEAEMKKVMELITAVRTRRSEMNVPPSKKAHLAIEPRTRPPLRRRRRPLPAWPIAAVWKWPRACPRPRAA